MVAGKSPNPVVPAPGRGTAGNSTAPESPYSIHMIEKLVEHNRYHYNALVIEVTLHRPITPIEGRRIARSIYIMVERKKIEAWDSNAMTIDIAVVSGRMPTWLYGMILHHIAHLVPIVAFYDPKMNGAIVVSCHSPHGPYVGEVIRI